MLLVGALWNSALAMAHGRIPHSSDRAMALDQTERNWMQRWRWHPCRSVLASSMAIDPRCRILLLTKARGILKNGLVMLIVRACSSFSSLVVAARGARSRRSRTLSTIVAGSRYDLRGCGLLLGFLRLPMVFCGGRSGHNTQLQDWLRKGLQCWNR